MKKIVATALLLMGLFVTGCGSQVAEKEPPKELTPEEKLNQEKWRMTIEGAKKIYQRDYAAKDTVTKSQEVKDTVPQSNQDTLQNLFLKMTLNTTEEELLGYIAADGLEYTAQDTAPKQIGYKIGYRKCDTYHTRSTGGDCLEVSFSTKSGKLLNATYFNAETSTQAMMTDAPFHGHKNDGRSSYYYFHDGRNFKVIDGRAATFEESLVDCYSAKDALARVKTKLK